MDTLQQAELNAKQKAKLAEEAGWNPRIAPRDTSPDGSTAWRADWWEKDTRPNGERSKSGYRHRTKQSALKPQTVVLCKKSRLSPHYMSLYCHRLVRHAPTLILWVIDSPDNA